MKIIIDDLTSPKVVDLLQEHITDMQSVSPPESKHALDLQSLRQPDITFWTVWEDNDLAGCGALKKLTETHAEIKSMRTAAAYLKRGVASTLLRHIIQEARSVGIKMLFLETGSMPYFKRAQYLYLKHGFEFCEPFADYKPDINSVFLTKELY
jgi:putative acetyltransferase